MILLHQRQETMLADDYPAKQFIRLLKRKKEHYPTFDQYDDTDYSKTWYRSQKQHILGWLKEYGGPGAYQRKSRGLTAKYFYNHFACAPGLLWLAEALGETPETLELAAQAATQEHHPSAKCAAIRTAIPWSRILQLTNKTPSQ